MEQFVAFEVGQEPRQEPQPNQAPAGALPRPAERLRVVLFTNSVAIGGMEKHVGLIARDLDRTQTELFAIVPEWEPIAGWAEHLARRVDYSVLLTPDRRYGLLAGLRDTARLSAQLRRWRIQVMHMHLTTYEGGFWAALAARLAGVGAIVCTEHLAPQRPLPWHRRLRRDFSTRILSVVVCVSGLNREARIQHLYTPAGRAIVVDNGIDLSAYGPRPDGEGAALRAQLGIPQEAPIVGSVVRLVAEKGLSYLLEAVPRVLAAVPDAHLLLVGDGPLRAELGALAERLGVRERVVFAGFQADPRPFLALLDVFVLPVPFGSASIGLLEALAMRRPVIVTFGSDDEAVVNGETGLRLPPRDPAALASGIVRVLSDPTLARELGERGRARVEQGFSSQTVARELLRLYQRLARSGGRIRRLEMSAQ